MKCVVFVIVAYAKFKSAKHGFVVQEERTEQTKILTVKYAINVNFHLGCSRLHAGAKDAG